MKKKGMLVLLAVLLAAAGYAACMESRFQTKALVPVQMSAEQIRTEMPQIDFTEADIAMAKALLADPEMQEAIKRYAGGESSVDTFPADRAERLLTPYLSEGDAVLELAVLEGRVYIGLRRGERQSVYYSFDPDLAYPEKTIGVYGKDLFGRKQVKAIYSSCNGALTKYIEKRIWFGGRNPRETGSEGA